MKTNLVCVYVNTKSQRLRFIATNSIESARGTEQSLKALLKAGWFSENVTSITTKIENVEL
jgi:hypothetical protein